MDIVILNRLLDVLEQAVGNYPIQYLHPMGSDRTWNAKDQCWVDEQSAVQVGV